MNQFSLARINFAAPVTLTMPGRNRVGTQLGGGTPKTFTGFDVAFTANPVTRTIHAEIPPLPRPLKIYGAEDFAAAAADTPEQYVERIQQILGSDPASVLQALVDGAPLPPAPPRVPREIANWRAKAILAHMGLLASVEAAIEALPEPDCTVVSLAWAGDAKLTRGGKTVLALASVLGLSEDQLDQLFVSAEALEI